MKTKIFKLAKTAWKKYPEWIVGVGGASIIAPLGYSSYKKQKRFNKLSKKHKLGPVPSQLNTLSPAVKILIKEGMRLSTVSSTSLDIT